MKRKVCQNIFHWNNSEVATMPQNENIKYKESKPGSITVLKCKKHRVK